MNYVEILKEIYGVEKVSFELKKMGKDRLYAFLRCEKKDELGIKEYHQGVYFGKLEKDGIRLSIEGCYLLRDEIKKNIIEVSYEDAIKWLRGEDLNIPYKGYVVLKWGKYFLGCGKGDGKKIRNYVPKERRII